MCGKCGQLKEGLHGISRQKSERMLLTQRSLWSPTLYLITLVASGHKHMALALRTSTYSIFAIFV